MKAQLARMFGLHENMINLRAQRTEIIASNLVNADTPGYKAKDLDFKNMLEDRLSNEISSLHTTHPNHLPLGEGLTDEQFLYRTPAQPSLDGNTVDTQLENAEFAENTMRYLASLRILDSKIKGLKAALRGE